MKVFHCDHCGHLLFFENTRCVQCDRALAYIAELGRVAALEPAQDDLWRVPTEELADRRYRLCDNYSKENVCNWAVRADDPHRLCESCRLTEIIPALESAAARGAWFRLEAAKRRLIYTLMQLRCPIIDKADDGKRGLAFRFLASTQGEATILTGHADGIITVNVAEADDAERERRRVQLHEPYRTLLGHLRHEVGHYYWQLLIDGQARQEPFRALFGDERADYAAALKHHYEVGPPQDWPQHFVSAYAASHPWEDWAESWAHYLHMTDMLETAGANGLELRPRNPEEPSLTRPRIDEPFEKLLESWFPLTYVLNNLNRSMGLADGYPFVLATPAIDKLRFIHETLRGLKLRTGPAAAGPGAQAIVVA